MSELIRKLTVLLSRRERWQAAALLAVMLGGSLLELAGVGAIPAFVAVLSDPSVLDRFPAVGGYAVLLGLDAPERLVLWGAVALLLLFVVKNAYLAAQSWITARYVYNRQIGIAQRLLRRYLYSTYEFHLHRNSAELIRNANDDALHVVGAGLLPLLTVAKELLTVAAVLLLLLWVEPVTSAVAFGILGGMTALFLRLMRRHSLHLGQEMHTARMEMIRAIQEGLGGIKVTRVLGREAGFVDGFARASERYGYAGRIRQVLLDSPRLFLETAGIAGLLGVAALLTAQGRPAGALIPTLTLLAAAVVRMIPSFNQISAALSSVRFGRSAIDALYQDLVSPEELIKNEDKLPFREEIRLEDVTYRYPNASEPSLNKVSLTIRYGEAIGFVGPTGAGKTTLVDIVLGLLNPTEGRLTVDGVDVVGRERAWQRQIGYVPQEIFLTDDTIRRNVAFGIPLGEINDEAVRQALKAAQAHEFVDRLPGGLDSMVGERGVRLSGGQRQRLGIARALYHDPVVLILDEATSALDGETEAAVMEAVESLHGSRTILMIAHRLTTVEGCDRVFKLKGGKLDSSVSRV
ncbi:ABC transporter ATP-binding protein [Cyanobium sp. To12R1]|uniref:ABC transporter ATP-binding protein n=1 Tax=Cyanobium sp. To12R1 TaxID=2823723 RepID=UPI0020CD4D21|nr:ABC transporter ATP-binding protein [Cyanobium sp. To12R1]MCP9781691.1 ABC transporter ATP-binding protein [Cyanobium sp. To12R1]